MANTDGMDGRYIEPRKVMWAVAEITWEDDNGTSFRVMRHSASPKSSNCAASNRHPSAAAKRWPLPLELRSSEKSVSAPTDATSTTKPSLLSGPEV